MQGMLVLQSYIPAELEIGMMFLHIDEDGYHVNDLVKMPEDVEQFYKDNGHPVNPYVIDDNGYIIATPLQIAWWDDGGPDDLIEMGSSIIEDIMNDYCGIVSIDDIDGEPFYYLNKIILSNPHQHDISDYLQRDNIEESA